MNRWKVRTNYNMGYDDWDLLISRRRDDGTYEYIKPFEMGALAEGHPISEMTIPASGVARIAAEDGLPGSRLYTKEFLAAALEAAWEMGLRPQQGFSDTTAQVKALTEHRDDLSVMLRHQLGAPQRK